jgi:hypothetical protein
MLAAILAMALTVTRSPGWIVERGRSLSPVQAAP